MLLFERSVLANLRFDDIAVYGFPLQEAKLGQLLRIEPDSDGPSVSVSAADTCSQGSLSLQNRHMFYPAEFPLLDSYQSVAITHNS